MRLLVRTWNLFHGNADPPRRRGYLHAMVELASRDRPGVLCLQEVPVWALPRLDDWSAMQRFSVITRVPLWPGPLGAAITRAHQGLFRSALSGQANALLVDRALDATPVGSERISDHGRERRLVHLVRVGAGSRGPTILIGGLHASNLLDEPSVPRAEAARAASFALSRAHPGEPIVLAGDFNVGDPGLAGWTAPTTGIDHVLARGATVVRHERWPVERRVQNGLVLSDHPPVDALVEVPS